MKTSYTQKKLIQTKNETKYYHSEFIRIPETYNNLLFNKLSITSGDTDKFLSMMFSIYNFYTAPFCGKTYWHQTDKDFIDIE